jgi:hypothetical protein
VLLSNARLVAITGVRVLEGRPAQEPRFSHGLPWFVAGGCGL